MSTEEVRVGAQKENLEACIQEFAPKLKRLYSTLSTAVVGQREMVQSILVALLNGEHVLLEGAPGLAKTLTVSSIAKMVSLFFRRVQFTPDLLPSDVIGTMVFDPKSSDFYLKKGPVFTKYPACR